MEIENWKSKKSSDSEQSQQKIRKKKHSHGRPTGEKPSSFIITKSSQPSLS